MHGDTGDDLPSEDTIESMFVVESGSDLPSCDDIPASGHEEELARTSWSWSCACNCFKDSDLRARAESLRATLQGMPRKARKRYVWLELRKMYSSDVKPRSHQEYRLFGLKVCRKSWCKAMVIGNRTLVAYGKSISEGMLGPPEDARQGQCLPRCRDDMSKDADHFSIGAGQKSHKICQQSMAEGTQVSPVMMMMMMMRVLEAVPQPLLEAVPQPHWQSHWVQTMWCKSVAQEGVCFI